jgi:hypothetical protein
MGTNRGKEGSERASERGSHGLRSNWRSSSLLSFINDKMKMLSHEYCHDLCTWLLYLGQISLPGFCSKVIHPCKGTVNRLIVDTAYIDTYTRDHCYSQVIRQWTHTPMGNLLRMETMISTNSWPKLVFEPGEEFDNRLIINMGDFSMYTWALIIAGTFTLFALCLSSHLLRSHLSNYNNPNVRFSPSFQPI